MGCHNNSTSILKNYCSLDPQLIKLTDYKMNEECIRFTGQLAVRTEGRKTNFIPGDQI